MLEGKATADCNATNLQTCIEHFNTDKRTGRKAELNPLATDFKIFIYRNTKVIDGNGNRANLEHNLIGANADGITNIQATRAKWIGN